MCAYQGQPACNRSACKMLLLETLQMAIKNTLHHKHIVCMLTTEQSKGP